MITLTESIDYNLEHAVLAELSVLERDPTLSAPPDFVSKHLPAQLNSSQLQLAFLLDEG